MPITPNGAFYTNTSQKELAVGLEMEMVLTYTTMALKKGTFYSKMHDIMLICCHSIFHIDTPQITHENKSTQSGKSTYHLGVKK